MSVAPVLCAVIIIEVYRTIRLNNQNRPLFDSQRSRSSVDGNSLITYGFYSKIKIQRQLA